MLMSQGFYFLYYTLNRGHNESHKKALLNFAFFVNVLTIPLQNFSFHQT